MNNFRAHFLSCVALLLVATGCAGVSPAIPLNSERIEARFGSYGVEILEQNAARRVTCLYSGSGAARRCRTLAIVRFADPPPAPLVDELADIRAGASLGATLAAGGWRVEKVNRYLGEIAADSAIAHSAVAYFSPIEATGLAVHIYDLNARRGAERLPVAALLEIHDPAYLGAGDVQKIYDPLPDEALSGADLEAWRAELRRIPAPPR